MRILALYKYFIIIITWEDILFSIDNLLMETEIQDSNTDLGFHEAALVLNRLEMAVSVLRAIVDMELDLDTNAGQVLGQLCSLLTDIYQYWGAKVSQMRRRTASLPNLDCTRQFIPQTREDHPLSSRRNY